MRESRQLHHKLFVVTHMASILIAMAVSLFVFICFAMRLTDDVCLCWGCVWLERAVMRRDDNLVCVGVVFGWSVP